MNLAEVEAIYAELTALDLPERFEFNSAVVSTNLRSTLETCIKIIRACWGKPNMTGPRIEDLLIVRDKLIGEKSHDAH